MKTVGDLLRDWRQRRRFSQLELAAEADISTRHLSFVERGRSAASRDMLLRLAGTLDMPFREQNRLLLAGGFAPIHSEQPLFSADLAAARAAVEAVLAGHMPFPAIAIDRYWNLILANDAITALLEGVDADLLKPPANVLRLCLHPRGLAPRIENLVEWRHHLLERLSKQIDATGDPELSELYLELAAFPSRAGTRPHPSTNSVVIPLRLQSSRGNGMLSFISTTTIFGSASDVTLSELALECFYPADQHTRLQLMHTVGRETQ